MNTYQTLAFDTDFKNCSTIADLNGVFQDFVDRLAQTAADELQDIYKISGVAEVFHHTTLAGAFVQTKVRSRKLEIITDKASEETVESVVLAQLGVTPSDDNDSDTAKENRDFAYSLAKLLSQSFKYSGSCMRALSVTVLSGFASCKTNDLFSPYSILHEYLTTELVCKDHEDNFCLIGRIKESRHRQRYSSPEVRTEFIPAKDKLTMVLVNKVEQLFNANDDTNLVELARLEEMKDFFADLLSRFFFSVQLNNLSRVFSLVVSVLNATDKDNVILERDLNRIAPAECIALLNHETIIRKDAIDLDSVHYRVNEGVKVFVALSERLNLFSGQKRALMAKVAVRL